jgi:hypothetical protein
MNITPGETVYAGKQCEGCKWVIYDVNFPGGSFHCDHDDIEFSRAMYANPNNDCPHFEEVNP